MVSAMVLVSVSVVCGCRLMWDNGTSLTPTAVAVNQDQVELSIVAPTNGQRIYLLTYVQLCPPALLPAPDIGHGTALRCEHWLHADWSSGPGFSRC